MERAACMDRAQPPRWGAGSKVAACISRIVESSAPASSVTLLAAEQCGAPLRGTLGRSAQPQHGGQAGAYWLAGDERRPWPPPLPALPSPPPGRGAARRAPSERRGERRGARYRLASGEGRRGAGRGRSCAGTCPCP
eukprot:363970-Chlamydomonas_euryale.AAC.19